jgi:hypothetical protein
MNLELVEFTRQALAQNLPRRDIADVLTKAGWQSQDVTAALSAFADVPFAVPVPKPKPYLSAREVFVYLIMFSALYATLYNVGQLAFEFINQLFPDPASTNRYYFFDGVRWNISTLVVTFPVFLFMFRRVALSMRADPLRRESKPRKWLTYLTLYVAAFTLAGDLISLVYNTLGGELTIRLILKMTVIAVLAGGNFLYFFSDMRREERP